MRFTWLIWLTGHFGEYGYSHGLLRGSIGTLAVLITAVLARYALRHQKPAVGLSAAGVVGAVGIGWLAFH